MRASSLQVYKCPACKGALTPTGGDAGEIVEGMLACACGKAFAVHDGVPDFVDPDSLTASEEESRREYEQAADEYDLGLKWLFGSFHENEDAVRARMADRLDARPGHRVLEVGCGTGRDSRHIVERIQPDGALFLQDLSPGMTALARTALADAPIELEFHLGNVSQLPFADGAFDALFHFGGLNVFGNKRRALREMTRVVRPGGKVVVGDESAAPWLRRQPFGRVIMHANPLYRHLPPLASLPENTKDVSLHWILGNAFYLIEFVVADGPPPLDLDLPIPGKRGGTLRSRYAGSDGAKRHARALPGKRPRAEKADEIDR